MPDLQLRALVKRAIAPAASGARFDRPIFILAPPRSGSTLLFECIAQFEETVHLRGEADPIWWHHFPYERLAEPSDQVAADEVSPAIARRLIRHTYREAVVHRLRRGSRDRALPHLLGVETIRYVDKTIAHCFHLEALERLFPDALYVLLVRDPAANIASMIEGWPYLERFGKPQLTAALRRVPGRTVEHWTYPAPPGWPRMASRPLAEICAWSWQRHLEAALGFFARRGRAPLRVTYEELTADPPGTVRALAGRLGLAWSAEVARHLEAPPLSHTTVSHPARDKWRVRHRSEVEAVLPSIAATAARIGYDVGRVAPARPACAR